jgi:hypothetical protein
MSRFLHIRNCAGIAWGLVLVFGLPLAALPNEPGVAVQLDISKAGPRKVEAETEKRIAADYQLAWNNLAQALASSTPVPLYALFVGPAKEWLQQSVASQKKSGLSTHYSDQRHHVQAVFYSPEGDVIELHDTAEYQTQILDGQKQIQSNREAHHFVVLMTPAADRWVIRQLFEVAQFQ